MQLSRFGEYEACETSKNAGWNAGRPIAYGKEIWDVVPLAWLVDPGWTRSRLLTSPVLHDDLTFSRDPHHPLTRELTLIDRDAVFGDLFTKLRSAGA